MTDREAQFEQLSAYLDGELSADEALELEAAIHSDEVLQAEFESLRQTRELLRQLPAETAPDHFAHAVLARAEKHHHLGKANPAGEYRSWRWIQLATAAVVLLAAGMGLIVISQMQSQQGEEPQDQTHCCRLPLLRKESQVVRKGQDPQDVHQVAQHRKSHGPRG